MSKNIYLISALVNDKKIYKIGITRRDVNTRVKELKTANPYELTIEQVYVAEKYGNSVESRIHRAFNTKLIDGEWFSLTQDDVNSFMDICEKYHNIFESLENNNTYIQDNKSINFK